MSLLRVKDRSVSIRPFLVMPTVLRHGPYRVYFFSHEPDEPPHVHVDRDDSSAKFWLEPLDLARNRGFGSKELRRIRMIVDQHRLALLEAWYDYHER